MISSAIDWLFSHWPLALSIVGGVVSLIGMFTEKMPSQSKRRKHFLILFGGILTIMAAAGTAIYQSADQAELKKKNDKILSLSESLDARTGELVEQGKVVTKLTKTIAERNHEIGLQNAKIAKIAQDSLSTVTGGDGYCHILFLPPSQKLSALDLMLTTEGKYPQYDVSIKITDVEKQAVNIGREVKKGNLPYDSMVSFFQLMSEGSKVIPSGNIGPNQSYPLGSLKLPDSTDKQSYIINIMARNGSVVQYLTCRRVNGVWKLAMKTYKRDKSVQETVEPGFPRNDKGDVQW